jgi:ABC-type dipeptide/oligopeptide/nickel transport system permease component
LLQTIVLVVSIFVVVINIVIDFVYKFIDPRVRIS